MEQWKPSCLARMLEADRKWAESGLLDKTGHVFGRSQAGERPLDLDLPDGDRADEHSIRLVFDRVVRVALEAPFGGPKQGVGVEQEPQSPRPSKYL